MGDLCKKAGAEWKKMSAAQKEKYEKEFAEYQKTQNYKDWMSKVEEWKIECNELKAKNGGMAQNNLQNEEKRGRQWLRLRIHKSERNEVIKKKWMRMMTMMMMMRRRRKRKRLLLKKRRSQRNKRIKK